MEFLGYDTCDKIIWKSGEGIINTNKISRQGNKKTHINKVSSTPTLGFGCSTHKEKIYILSEYLVLSRINAYFKKQGLYWSI